MYTQNYLTELDGQIDFYKTYLPRINKDIDLDDVFTNYTDGVVNGNILEFKLTINDLSSVLFQAIKYLSSMRVKGHSIPANIILISLNTNKAYIYSSEKYLSYIEKLYTVSASKDNFGFQSDKPLKELDLTKDLDQEKLIGFLKTNNYTKINIDENCIVGWGQRYYRENPLARKSDFIGGETDKTKIIGEIRNPVKFKELIHPYKGGDNVKFRYLMDKLNENLAQKNLGAYYTPKLYAEKSLQLLRQAINRVPEGNDYVIIDRCAGTGNLEQFLTDEELQHVIVSTLEYYEYKVLSELLGDKVRHLIPPTEKIDTFNMGLVRGADALSEEYLNSDVIQSYINDDKCTIILFENPPYAETTSIEHQKKKAGKASSVWKQSYVLEEMKKEVKGTVLNDLGNAFIWSAFKYYLRQPTDSYIVYSPIKYWKAQHLVDNKFLNGFAFNRKHFHTNIDACVLCVLWSGEKENSDSFKVEAFDIVDKKIKSDGWLDIKKIFTTYSKVYYDSRKFEDDKTDGILTALNGEEVTHDIKKRILPLYNENMVGYLVADGAGFDNPDLHSSLLVAGRYNGNGFFLRRDTFLEKLPLFLASRYITYNRKWTERARIMKCADGSKKFFADLKSGKLNKTLQKAMLFTALEMQNHCRSFEGSDGRFYENQFCLDNTNGETLASQTLKSFEPNAQETELLKQWKLILDSAKQTINYDENINYGIYQIFSELNTYYYDEKKNKVFDYPELNGHLNSLKQLVKKYYLDELVPFLFKYEFIK